MRFSLINSVSFARENRFRFWVAVNNQLEVYDDLRTVSIDSEVLANPITLNFLANSTAKGKPT